MSNFATRFREIPIGEKLCILYKVGSGEQLRIIYKVPAGSGNVYLGMLQYLEPTFNRLHLQVTMSTLTTK